MGVAFAAQHLGTEHAMTDILFFDDMILGDRLPIARPAAAAVVFGRALEQFLAAAGAHISAGLPGMGVLAGEGRFGAVLAAHLILLGRELFLPFGVGFLDFVGHFVALAFDRGQFYI